MFLVHFFFNQEVNKEGLKVTELYGMPLETTLYIDLVYLAIGVSLFNCTIYPP